MRRRTPAWSAIWCSCTRAAPADQACPRVGPEITQNNGSTGSATRSASHGCRVDHPQASIPTSRRRSFLPCLTRIDPRRSSRSVSVSESASLIRSPARQSTTISPVRRLPYRAWRAWRMTAMISSTVAGSAAYRCPLFPGALSAQKIGHRRWRAAAAGSIEQLLSRGLGSLP